MMILRNLLALAGTAAILAACAQQEEPARVAPQPVFDKFGNGECEEGWVLIPGATAELVTCIPEDECEDPVVNTATGEVICRPPPRDDDDDDPSSSTGRSPTGSSTTPTGTAGRP